MYDKVIKALEPLGIDLEFQEYQGSEDEYIIFDIHLEKEEEYAEDKAQQTISYITINYCHKSKLGINKYREIKEAMKKHGFFFDYSKTLPRDCDYYVKNFDFIYKEDMEEIYE